MKKMLILTIIASAACAISGCRSASAIYIGNDDEDAEARAAYEEMYQEEMDDYYNEFLGY